MIRNGVARFGLVVAAIGAAACSQAQISLILASNGMAALVSPNDAVFSETVDFQSAGSPSVSSLLYTLNTTTLTGFGVYSGSGGMLDFTYSFDAASYQKIAPNEASIDGSWTFTGGTGGYAAFPSGKGSIALTYLFTSPTTALTATSFSGQLAPEPTSYLVMGIGVAGLLVRRRRRRV